MKKKNSDTEELERLNSDLFRSFDPEDETWIVGGSKTITDGLTITPEGRIDGYMDIDWNFEETTPAT